MPETIDMFLREFAPFAELAEDWQLDHQALQTILDRENVPRIDDTRRGRPRLGRYAAYYDRNAASAAMRAARAEDAQ